jgi:hypothetical protein
MLLQAMADQFGLPVKEYADTAFQARLAPKFSYGCAVFLDSDRVNFQKEGYSREELLAGLALVLPKNVWQYVVQIPRMSALGTGVRPPGRHAVEPRGGQGAGRLHQGARPGRRDPRASSSGRGGRPWRRTRGEACRRETRPLHLHRPRGCHRTEVHFEERREHRLPLLPEPLQAHLHRHAQRERTREPLHLRILLREWHRSPNRAS